MPTFKELELKWFETFTACLTMLAGGIQREATAKMMEAVQTARYQFGPTHEHVAAGLTLLGTAHLTEKNTSEAHKCFKEARQYADLAVEHWIPEVQNAAAFSGAAAACMIERNFTEAAAHFQRVIALADRSALISGLRLWQLHLVLGESLFFGGQYAEAIRGFRRAEEFLLGYAAEKGDYQRLAYIQARIGFACFQLGEFKEAQAVLESVVNLHESYELENSALFVGCINLLSTIYRELGNAGSAEVYLSWGLESTQNLYGMESSQATHALNFAAAYYLSKKDWSKAAECLRDALAYVDKVVESEETLWILDRLLMIAALQDDLEEQQHYQGILAGIYANEYSGNYLRDLALVASGDQGAAAQRQGKLKGVIDEIQARYEQRLHPQLSEVLASSDEKHWISAALTLSKLYAVKQLGDHSSGAVPQNQGGPPEKTSPPEGLPSSSGDEPPDWNEDLVSLIEADRFGEAAALLEKAIRDLQAAEGGFSPGLLPMLEALASVHEKAGNSLAAHTARVQAQLAACKI